MKILQKIENLNNLQYLVNKFCYDEQMKGDITEIISKRFVDLGFLEKTCRDFNINGIEGWNLLCKIQEYKSRILNN